MYSFRQYTLLIIIFFTLIHTLFAYHSGFYPQFHRKSSSSQDFRRQLRQIQFDNFPNGFVWNGSQNRRRSPQSDAIFFRDDDDSNPNLIPAQPRPTTNSPQRTTTVAIPGMGTTRSACEDLCLITSEYNPVCGTDGMTYSNVRRLTCAIECGKRVSRAYIGRCTRLQ